MLSLLVKKHTHKTRELKSVGHREEEEEEEEEGEEEKEKKKKKK